jgi:KUP system potassium uptake protein
MTQQMGAEPRAAAGAAGHHEQGHEHGKGGFLGLIVGSIGVVYGDIGTSPH